MAKRRKEPAFQRKKKNHAVLLISALVVLSFCGFLGFRNYEEARTKALLEQEILELQTKIDDESKRADELKEFEIYTHTNKYAEEVAKDILGYVYEDEIIFKPES